MFTIQLAYMHVALQVSKCIHVNSDGKTGGVGEEGAEMTSFGKCGGGVQESRSPDPPPHLPTDVEKSSVI